MGGVKNKWGSNSYYDITTYSLFHFFRNRKKSEAFLLRISLGNVNGLVVDILKFTISVLEKNF